MGDRGKDRQKGEVEKNGGWDKKRVERAKNQNKVTAGKRSKKKYRYEYRENCIITSGWMYLCGQFTAGTSWCIQSKESNYLSISLHHLKVREEISKVFHFLIFKQMKLGRHIHWIKFLIVYGILAFYCLLSDVQFPSKCK